MQQTRDIDRSVRVFDSHVIVRSGTSLEGHIQALNGGEIYNAKEYRNHYQLFANESNCGTSQTRYGHYSSARSHVQRS